MSNTKSLEIPQIKVFDNENELNNFVKNLVLAGQLTPLILNSTTIIEYTRVKVESITNPISYKIIEENK